MSCIHLCQQYKDYIYRVLLPEIMIKIVMDINHIDHDEAEMRFNLYW